MSMPLQPPTRPHSANPNIALKKDVFQRPGSPVSSGRTSGQASNHVGASSLSHPPRGEAEWDDAWDSSSDKEEEHERVIPSRSTGAAVGPIAASSSAASKAISIQQNTEARSLERSNSQTSTTPASWTSSFQHVSVSPSSGPRPALPSSKTYTEGAAPPPPGTEAILAAAAGKSRSSADGSARPTLPEGAWEIIDSSKLEEEDPAMEDCPPLRAGPEAVRENVEDILRDPLVLLSCLSLDGPPTPGPIRPDPASSFPFLTSSTSSTASSSRHFDRPSTPSRRSTASPVAVNGGGYSTPKRDLGRQRSVRTERRRDQFLKALTGRKQDTTSVDIGALRSLAWSGIPDEVRPIAWQLLLNYLPSPVQPRLATLNRKRKEYSQLVEQYFGRGLASLDQQIWHQIEIDVPRTRPGVPLWQCTTTQRSLERVLYVWAIRHPASGYVQGINDLVTPFFEVFLSAYIDTEPELFDTAHLPDGVLAAIEADSFWCLSKLLDGIQDNYISHQPGIHRLVTRMGELVKRIDAPLALHLEDQGVEFMQFAFRWMNCLLMREMSVRCTIRMWDTYLAEGTDAFSQFHLYVCSALLTKYSAKLKEMDFQEIIMFLQRLPTQQWTDHDVELLLSEAYVLKSVWQGAENHFAGPGNGPTGGSSFGMLGR